MLGGEGLENTSGGDRERRPAARLVATAVAANLKAKGPTQ